MSAKVILNGYAGRWTALQRKDELIKALQAANIAYDLVLTDRPGHGKELAYQAVLDGFSPIVSAGGDGSHNEVVNGIIRATLMKENSQLPPFGVMPMGSANDFSDNMSIPQDLAAAARVLQTGTVRRMDLCQVNERYFVNNAAIGLEPYITLIQARIHRLRGTLRYLVATLKGILDNPRWNMQLEWEGGSYSGPVNLVTVGNNPRTGGLFFMTPHADPFDGKLTFVYGFMASRRQILSILPRTMKPGDGSYVEHPAMHEIHTTWLRVHSEKPTPAHADGEIISEKIKEVNYCVYPEILPVILPG